MSGDVQPRKRRDKKKKKDDDEGSAHSHMPRTPSISPLDDDDVTIHVQKDSHTGGGICAKLVFFILLSALAVLIGLIITEHRGLTDLDTIEKESKFTQYFEGWVDNTPEEHDDHHGVEDHDHDDGHDEEHGDHDDHDDHDEDHDDDHDDEHDEEHDDHDNEEHDDDHEEEEEVEASEEQDESIQEGTEEEEEYVEEGTEEDTEEGTEEAYEEEEEEQEEAEASQEATEEESVQEATEEEPTEEDGAPEESAQNDDDNAYEGEGPKTEEDQDDDDDDDDEQGTSKEDDVEDEEEQEVSNEDDEAKTSKEEGDDDQVSDEAAADQGVSKEDDEAPSKEDTVDQDDDEEETEQKSQEKKDEADQDQPEETEDDDNNVQSISVVKAAVGLVILVVAYIVLIRKWKSAQSVQEPAIPEEPHEESVQSAPSYDYENTTNENDFTIVDQLDEAQENLNINAALALSQFAAILKKYPRSPRATYGRGRALDLLAEQRQSNQLLTEAITNYMALMTLEDVPAVLLKITGERCINRLRFMGQYPKAIDVHRKLINRFPNEISYRNQLAVTYLTNNRMEEARKELKQTLDRWPSDGFALVHYGFIIKVHDSDLETAIKYLQRGIATREEGVIDGRFYFHLGDALARLGRHDDATAIYEGGARQKVFLSPKQRSLYNVPTLKAQPWWSLHETPSSYREFFNALERNWIAIRDEGLAVMNSKGLFQDEAENLKDKGDWKQFELFARGVKHRRNCERCPLTCRLVASLPEAVGCRRGQIKFSVMLPGTHVWPHCGPTNCRLRAHLGLKVPDRTYIRVDEEIRSWEEGEIIIFDDSFEHEVWHKGDDFRLVLIVDVWHPELTIAERRTLPTI